MKKVFDGVEGETVLDSKPSRVSFTQFTRGLGVRTGRVITVPVAEGKVTVEPREFPHRPRTRRRNGELSSEQRHNQRWRHRQQNPQNSR